MGPGSPLGQAVQRLVETQPSGLHKADLLKRLRQTHPFVQEQHLNEILADPLSFTERPGLIWVLTRLLEAVQADEPAVEADQPPLRERDPRDRLPIVPLPLDLSTYVGLDFETSGFDPQSEPIIQFAAVRVENGQIVDGCNLFVRPTKPLPFSLQQKLNLADNQDKLDRIEQTPPIEQQIHEIAAFVGSWPLVAHNGRFDYRFLREAIQHHLHREPANPLVDTMEMALLINPRLPSYALEKLAGHLGIDPAQAGASVPSSVAGKMGLDLAEGEFHDAAFDVLVLGHVFVAMWAELGRLPVALHAEMLRLLPRTEYILSGLLPADVQPAAASVWPVHGRWRFCRQ